MQTNCAPILYKEFDYVKTTYIGVILQLVHTIMFN
jgi:hypothetical protein